MSEQSSPEQAVARLRELGLREYEARCFVALTRLSAAKAREIGETGDVPRTRVYDAVERLGEMGLVETRHASPKRFRAVGIDEAVDVLRARYDRKFAALDRSLRSLDPVADRDESEAGPTEVWTLSGVETIGNRVRDLVDDADEEVVYLVGDGGVVSEDVLASLAAAGEDGVGVHVDAASTDVYERVASAVPAARRVQSPVDWLWTPVDPDRLWALGHVLVVDRRSALVSAHRDGAPDDPSATAVWTTGVGNGLGLLVERLLNAGVDGDANGDRTDDPA